MCSKELCVQFMKAHGNNNCLFEGPSGGNDMYSAMYEDKKVDYSASRVQY